MKSLMSRIKALALLVALVVNGGAWGSTKNCAQGQDWYVTSASTKVFEGVRLSDIGTSYRLCGKIKGGWMPTAAEVYACNRYEYTSETAVRYEMQYLDGTTIKCVVLKLTEESVSDGESYNVLVKATTLGAKQNGYYGYQFKTATDDDSVAAASDWSGMTLSSNGSDGAYGIYDLRLISCVDSSTAWMDFEFNGNLNNTGASSASVSLANGWGDGVAYAHNSSVYTYGKIGNSSNVAMPSEWTAIFRCTTPVYNANGTIAVVAFGNNSGNVIGFASAREANKVLLKNQDDNTIGAEVSVTDPTYSMHVYAIEKTPEYVRIYVDGQLEASGTVSLSPADGFQFGTVRGGGLSSHFYECSSSLGKPHSRFDFFRLYDGLMPEGFISSVAAANPVEYIDYSATVSENKSWSGITWDEGTWLNSANITANVTVENSPTVNFDSAVTAATIAFESASGGVTLTGAEPAAAYDFSGVNGNVTIGYTTTAGVSSRTGGLTLTNGAGAENSAISFTPEGGSITFDGSGGVQYYISMGHSGNQTTIDFENATATMDSFDLGQATSTVGGDSAITAGRVILSQGAAGRTASLTLEDSASMTVTSTVNGDTNKSAIMFGHWSGPSTFTLKNSASFNAPGADILVGKTGNNQTINIQGGTLTAQGIKLAANASGINAMTISGGEVKLGSTGITSYSTSSTMTVSVTGDAKISTATSSTSLPITQEVTVSANKVLTLDGGGTITFNSLTMQENSSLVLLNGTKIAIVGGSIDDSASINVGDNCIDIGQIRTGAEFTFGDGAVLVMTEVVSESGTTTLNVANDVMPTIVLHDASGNVLSGVIPSITSRTLTVSSSAGQACWMDYEFNGNANSIGTDATELSGSHSHYCDERSLYITDTPYRALAYPNTWSVVTRFTNPDTVNTVIITFGTKDGGYLGFVSGGKGTVKFIARSGTGAVQTLQSMSISSAPRLPHVYAIVKTSTSVKLYLDGNEEYSNDSITIDIGGGMQLGSMHSGIANGYTNAASAGAAASIDFLRLYQSALSVEVISAIVADYALSPDKTYNAVINSNTDLESILWNSAYSWSNDSSVRMVLGVIDDVELTVPAKVCAYDITFAVANGKTLTLKCAGAGSALYTEAGLTIGQPGYGGAVAVDGALSVGPVDSGASDAALDIPQNSSVTVLGDIAVNVTGAGSIIYTTFVPKSGSGTKWTDNSSWTGTVWFKDNASFANFNTDLYGNEYSRVKFSNCSGYLTLGTGVTLSVPIEVEGNGFNYNNGNGSDRITIKKLLGTGTFQTSNYGNNGVLHIVDVSEFTGNINATCKQIVMGDEDYNIASGTTDIDPARSGTVILKGNAVIASGKTWTIGSSGTLVVESSKTLDVSGTISAAVNGAGTVVYHGKFPDGTATGWNDSTKWTGTLEIKDATQSNTWYMKNYGNSNSTLIFNNFTSVLYQSTGDDHLLKSMVIAEGGWTLNGAYSSGTFNLPGALTGSGAITIDIKNSAYGTTLKQVLFSGDVTSFTGAVKITDTANAAVVFGSTTRTPDSKQIIVGSGTTVKVESGTTAWEAAGGIIVDGTMNVKDINWPSKPFQLLCGSGTLKFQNSVIHWFSLNSDFTGSLNLVKDDSSNVALTIKDGGRDYVNTFSSLTGDGTLKAEGKARQTYKFGDASTFTGSFDIAVGDDTINGFPISGRRVVVGTSSPDENFSSSITVDSGCTAALGNGASWKAPGHGFAINGTLVIKGAGTLENATTLGNGATLRFDSLSTMDVNEALTSDGTVTVAFNGVTPEAGQKLIAWSNIPAGTFTAEGYTLLKASSGLYISPSNPTDSDSTTAGSVSVVDGKITAVLTDTSKTVTIPAGVEAIELFVTGESSTLATGTLTPSASNVKVYSTDSAGAKDTTYVITGAFKFTNNGDGTYTVALDDTATVGGVTVRPAVGVAVTIDDTPTQSMVLESGAPQFAFATIPGLWYGAETSADGISFAVDSDTVTQATDDATQLTAADAPASGVKYYKVAVGASKAALE